MSCSDLTGAVLAGGASRRMGQDKASLMVEGEPLWHRQIQMLRATGMPMVGVVRQRGQPALHLGPKLKLWHDTTTDAGPMAGLHAALTACETEWLAVVATDMPRISASWFEWLRGFCRPGCGAMARHTGGSHEPLAAIYPRAALPEVTRRLRIGSLSLQSLADVLITKGHLAGVRLPASELWQMENWNTPLEAGNGCGPKQAVSAAPSQVHAGTA